MKDLNELQLFNEIKNKYTNLYLLLDDCYEDDKSGVLEERAEEEKSQIVLLVKETSRFGVDVDEVVCFDDLKRCKDLQNWYVSCREREEFLEK